jgi:hypothetical protein
MAHCAKTISILQIYFPNFRSGLELIIDAAFEAGLIPFPDQEDYEAARKRRRRRTVFVRPGVDDAANKVRA